MEPQSCRRLGFDPGVWKIPWRRKWQPTLVFLSGKISWTEEAWQATVHRVTKGSDMTVQATECKTPWIAKAILRKNNKARGITLPEFKLHYKTIVIRGVWYWPRDKPKHMQSTNIWQRSQDIQWRKDSLFNKRCWNNWIFTCKRMKIVSCIILPTELKMN